MCEGGACRRLHSDGRSGLLTRVAALHGGSLAGLEWGLTPAGCKPATLAWNSRAACVFTHASVRTGPWHLLDGLLSLDTAADLLPGFRVTLTR